MASVPAAEVKESGILNSARVANRRRASLIGVTASLALIVATGTILGAATKQGAGRLAGEPTTAQLLTLMSLFAATALAFLLVIGLALRSTGIAVRKNALKAMMAQFTAAFMALLAFFFVGFALQSGGFGSLPGAHALGGMPALTAEVALPLGHSAWGVLGARGFTLSGGAYDASAGFLFVFQASIMIVAILIPLAAAAQRMRMSAVIIFALFAAAVLYPVYANWVWGGGWLSQLGTLGLGAGYVDFGGSGVIHAIGGWAALAAVIVVRPRIRKFNMDETPNTIPPHNLVFVLAGSFLCTLGWFGLVAGSVLTQDAAALPRLGLAMVVILLAGAGGATTSLLYAWMVERPYVASIPTKGFPDPSMAANGFLAGFVAGSAACLCISPLSGLIVGAVAGLLVPVGLTVLEERFLIDDASGSVTIHGVCGLWGQLAVGIFADGTLSLGGHPVAGLVSGDVTQLGAQLVGGVVAVAWGFGGAYLFFSAVNRVFRLRVPSNFEMHRQGMDVLELGAPAYAARPNPVHGAWPRVAEGIGAYQADVDSD
jgi:Amt family ammonium transporter